MAMPTPTQDLALSFTRDTSGRLVVDLILTPTGDLLLIQGLDLLVQNVTRWLLTPEGSNPFDPTYGNPLAGLIGQAQTTDDDLIGMIEMAEDIFVAMQAAEARDGYLTAAAQVDHFGAPLITHDPQNPARVTVSFTITNKAGATATATVGL